MSEKKMSSDQRRTTKSFSALKKPAMPAIALAMQYEVTPPSDDETGAADMDTAKEIQSDSGNETAASASASASPSSSSNTGRFLSPDFARSLSEVEAQKQAGPGRRSRSPSVASRRSSIREKLSSAGSYISLFLEHPKKYLEDRCGFFLAFTSGLLLTFYSALYQRIKEDIARATVLLLRGALQFTGLMGIAYALEIPLRLKDMSALPTSASRRIFWLVFLTAVAVGGLRLNIIFGALQLSPMSIVHTLMSGSPVLVMILSHFLLNKQDPFTGMKALASVLLIVGVTLNTDPMSAVQDAINFRNLETGIGISLSFLAFFFSALGSIFTKKITAHVDKLHISAYIGLSIFVFSLFSAYTDSAFLEMRMAKRQNVTFPVGNSTGAITLEIENTGEFPPETNMTCVYQLFLSKAPDGDFNDSLLATFAEEEIETCLASAPPYFPSDPDVWCMALAVAVLGISQQFCLIAAIKRDTPSRVTMTRSISIVFSFFVQIWEEPGAIPSWNQWLGALVILASIFLVSMDHMARRIWRAAKKHLTCRLSSVCCSGRLCDSAYDKPTEQHLQKVNNEEKKMEDSSSSSSSDQQHVSSPLRDSRKGRA